MTAANQAAPALGRITTAAFVLLLASTNAVTPLLPLYQVRFDLDRVATSSVFAVYMFVLAPILWLCGRPQVQRHAPRLILLALLAIIVGNLLMGSGTLAGLYAGRAMSGIAVGLGTGATATIALAALGERGRTIAATGNLVGAVIGTLVSATTAEWTPYPTSMVFWLASGAAVVGLPPLLVLLRRHGAPVQPEVIVRDRAMHGSGSSSERISGYVLGCAAWTFVMIALVTVPSAMRTELGIDSPLVSGAVALILLVSAAVAQYGIGRFPRLLGPAAVSCYLLVGMVLIGAGMMAHAALLVVVGMGVGGAGNGAGYRLGLLSVTRGLVVERHGAATSRYVFVAYFVGASAVILASGAATALGVAPAWWLSAIAIGAGCGAALAVVQLGKAGGRTHP